MESKANNALLPAPERGAATAADQTLPLPDAGCEAALVSSASADRWPCATGASTAQSAAPAPRDAATPNRDAAAPSPDAATPARDAATRSPDAAAPFPDTRIPAPFTGAPISAPRTTESAPPDGTAKSPESRLNPNAVVAVDVVVFTLRPTPAIEDRWQVLLVRRDEPVFGNKLSLPGVLVRADETFDAAARRALQTKAGLDARDWYLEQLGTFGNPGRDTRGRVVSVAHVALVRSDDLDLVRGSGIRSHRLGARPQPARPRRSSSTMPTCCAWPSIASRPSCATPGSRSS